MRVIASQTAVSDLLADDETSWPEALRRILDERRTELTEYLKTEAKIDHAAEKDVGLRWDRPENELEPVWRATVCEAQALISSHRIVGYHCTRLTPEEQETVREQGMEPLSPALIERRVAVQLDCGRLCRTLAQSILADNKSAASNRTGLLYWIFHRATLKHKSAVERLLRNWGGEAVYWSREENAEGAALRKIGTPCVVVRPFLPRS